MGLPKLDQPFYRHKLVGLNKEIKYRAFTVKEQKLLLSSKESDDPIQIVDSIKQILSLCVQDDIDVESLPFFDIEDLFVRIRSKSVSNEVKLSYKDKETEEVITVNVNLDDVKVQTNEQHSTTIMLTDSIGLKMSYPTLDMIKNGTEYEELIKQCINTIFTEDEVMLVSDYSDKELTDFIDQFDLNTMTKLKHFFDTMPRLRHEIKINLKGKEEPEYKIIEGIEDLFT